jgi:hypothetical protein
MRFGIALGPRARELLKAAFFPQFFWATLNLNPAVWEATRLQGDESAIAATGWLTGSLLLMFF